ncbi:hypothetical protein elemo79Aphanotate_52 [Flavobacterium phage vB_FspP_elemoA_7-9A]|uniref:Uncharacterized protein n=1 Tax=Flavobacterium phage vB_FspP_elemoA_7-9A TaxID=2743781 RepID=A0A7D5FMA5_9CAUD|nr:hypothetical protein KNV10_gp59 [Flavobacterium phage vB_FspP_elemoA_7-9A]QLF85246.1 hypothetical protein elemo79Aphanotate_52 [Flavobacterium phage vB_FspP_elemoA_7-9A]
MSSCTINHYHNNKKNKPSLIGFKSWEHKTSNGVTAIVGP